MMGKKERGFAPLVQVSLEALVPPDHFYRHLERTLDLSFVREFVQQTYACKGRPSIDPVVFFKLQLVMFFEDIRSERLLMRHLPSFWLLLAGLLALDGLVVFFLPNWFSFLNTEDAIRLSLLLSLLRTFSTG